MSVGRFCIRDVVTIEPTESVRTAASRMAEQEVGSLIVVEKNRPVGIVTDRDLVIRVLATGISPEQTPITSVMTPDPICISEHASLEGAIARIRSHQIRRLVVINETQELVGIFTLDDLLELLAEEREALEAVTSAIKHSRHHSE